MTLPASGAISLNGIQTEFGGANPIGLNEYYKGGSYVNSAISASIPTSGTISIGNFYGASSRVTVNLTIGGSTTGYCVYANRGAGYVAGISDITVTVNSGVIVNATNTSNYAMLVPAAFNASDTVKIVNNGAILGSGGSGGQGGSYPSLVSGYAGSAGGNALYVNRPTTVVNNGNLYGGGGGGGGGGVVNCSYCYCYTGASGGGGGGGGAGSPGGSGGYGGTAYYTVSQWYGGGGPGGTGSTYAGGSGGGGGGVGYSYNQWPGGAGGGSGASGATGGGYSASYSSAGSPGGGAGKYIVGNAFVTWGATGSRAGGAA